MRVKSAVSGMIMLLLFGIHDRALAQWYQFPDLRYTNIYCVLAVSDSTVFVGGDNATLLRSTDHGNTWISVMGGGIYADTVLSLAYGDGYVFAGANGVESVYRSSDGGASWSAANAGLPSSAVMNGFAFSGDTIYAATSYGVYSSADSGATWKADTNGLALDQLYPGQGGGTVGIAAARWAVYTIKSQFGSVYESPTDSIWWTQVAPDTFNMGYAMAAIDTNIFIGTLKGVFLYSGGTWTPRNSDLPIPLYSCVFASVDTLLFADFGLRNGPLYLTTDLGETWIEVNDSAFGGTTVTGIAANGKYLFAGTQAGAWRIPLSDVVTSVNQKPPAVPSRFDLYQNYPNPFNPTTAIRYKMLANGLVTLKVYDVLGREVSTLVEEKQNAGSHTVTFNAARLPSGIYFYRLQTSGYSSTKKMILLK